MSYNLSLTSASGKLAYHHPDAPLFGAAAFNTANWTVGPAGQATLSLSSSKLRITHVSGTHKYIRYDPVASRGKAFVSMIVSSNSGPATPGVAAHISDLTGGSLDGVETRAPMGWSYNRQIHQFLNGVESVKATNATSVNATIWSHSLFVDGTSARARIVNNFYGALDLGPVTVDQSAGQLGIYTINDTITIDLFYACIDRYLTFTGLESGDTVELWGTRSSPFQSVAPVAADVTGTAVLDLCLMSWAGPERVVVKRAGVTIHDETLSGTLFYGGETWAFTDAGAPGAPSNVQATTPANLSSTLTWDAATDPNSDPLQYEGDYWNGSSWAALFALQTFGTLSYSWDTSGLAEGSSYKARIRAHDGTSYGDYAESNNVTVQHAPGTPVITAAADSPTQATVTVGTPGSTATAHYLYMSLSAIGVVAPENLIATLGATPAPQVVSGLTPGQTYYFVLVAENENGTTESDVKSATTPADTVEILVTAVSSTEAEVEFIDLSVLATSYKIYMSQSPSDLNIPPSPTKLINTQGAPPSVVPVTGLQRGQVYYFRAEGTNGVVSSYSSIEVLDLPDTDGWLSVTDITNSSATFHLNGLELTDDLITQYQWTFEGLGWDDPAYPPNDSGEVTGETEDYGRLIYPVTGIGTSWSSGNPIIVRARWKYTDDTSGWSEWVEIEFQTLSAWTGTAYASHWTNQIVGQIFDGSVPACFYLHVDESKEVVLFEIGKVEDDGTINWVVITPTLENYMPPDSMWKYYKFCLDVSGYDEGYYKLRFTTNDGEQFVHFGIRIITGVGPISALATSFEMGKYAGLTPLSRWMMPTGGGGAKCQSTCPSGVTYGGGESFDGVFFPACTYPPHKYVWGHIGHSIDAGSGVIDTYGPLYPEWVTNNLGADVTANFFSMTNGGGWFWEWPQVGELITLGVGLMAQNGQPRAPIYAQIFTNFSMGGMAWSGEECGGYDWYASGRSKNGTARLTIGPFTFTRPINVYFGWLKKEITYGCVRNGESQCCRQGTCGITRGIPIRLKAWRPDKVNFPRRWRAIATFHSPYTPSGASAHGGSILMINGTGQDETVIIDETVDLDYDIDCGGIVVFDNKYRGANAGASGRFLHSLSMVPLDVEDCETSVPDLPESVVPKLPPIVPDVTVYCGDVVVEGLLGGMPFEFDGASEIEIRRVDTLEMVYSGSKEDSARWFFSHTTHGFPYWTALEVRMRWIDLDATVSDWSDWVEFTLTYEWEECNPVPVPGVRRILFGEPGGDAIDIAWSAKRRIIFGEPE